MGNSIDRYTGILEDRVMVVVYVPRTMYAKLKEVEKLTGRSVEEIFLYSVKKYLLDKVERNE